MKKPVLIGAGIVVAAVVLVGSFFVHANNTAITLEEQINDAAAQIQVQEKRRVDLVYNLVDTVQNYDEYESSTLTSITEARTSADSGNVDEAVAAINAVAEAYPDLKSSANYTALMNELSLTENSIAQYRNSYNTQVKNYNKFIRTFPNNIFLSILGYEQIDADYTDYDAPSDAPQNLFD